MEPFNIAIAIAEFPRSDAYFSDPHLKRSRSKGGIASLKLSCYKCRIDYVKLFRR